ncbi:MAG: pyridoxine 5'-phosphate synthase [Xanthomonadales bacterium]|jgi:pyridoxine 5-phosphate synthase|nr:pyridoxine 5'-phosphate synthase [Xanthomonadales bacterium]
MPTRLSVNVNKIAVLRNSRGGREPEVLTAARVAVAAGAEGITVHPRPDLRHIRPDDVLALAGAGLGVELNIEGNPFAPPNARYPGLLALVEQVRPAQVTLVPDGDGQITSDHGFDLVAEAPRLAPLVRAFRDLGARVSLFVDPDVQTLEAAVDIGAERIELYTGPYAEAFAAGRVEEGLLPLRLTAERAVRLGLGVNAGHDLSQLNLRALKEAVPGLLEVSIGHALIGEALYEGLDTTVRRYLALLAD